VQRRGYEGMVAKDEGAMYRGGPSRTWLKVKVRHEGLFLIGGVGLGEGVRGLLVGERDGERLLFLAPWSLACRAPCSASWQRRRWPGPRHPSWICPGAVASRGLSRA